MTAPVGTAARPLRVVVLGSSAAFMVMPRPQSSLEQPWVAQLQELLRAKGLHSDVTVHTRWHTTVEEVLPHYEPWVRDHFPDAVVVNLGMAECQARVVPTWLLRNTMTWLPGRGALATGYRRSVLARGVRGAVRQTQRVLAPRVGLAASRVPPRRFVRSMTRLAQLCSRDSGAAVLLLDIDMPHGRVLHWMPGLPARVDAYNALLREVAAGFPAGAVSVVETARLVAGDDAPSLLPDGLHRSAAGHRLVARHVVDELVRTLEARGVLDPATEEGDPDDRTD